MKWIQVDNYHIKCNTPTAIFYISKSMIYDKVIYELWNGNKWLYKSEKIEDAKEYAERYY
jgi:hypothetical protein